MATFTFNSPDGKSYSVQGPDGATPEQAFGILQQHLGTEAQQPSQPPAQSVSPAMDFLRSIPGGVLGGIANTLSTGGQAAQTEMGQPVDVPGTQQTKQIVEQNVTGKLPEPQGRAGKFGQSVGEFVGNPSSYIGPGSLPLKIGGAVLSGLGSEAGGQLAEGTPYEGAARIAGAVAGGSVAARALGPKVEEAAIPTSSELIGAARQQYKDAAKSGLELNPSGVAQFASAARQDLTNGPERTFTGGQFGTAPKTFAVLDALERPPSGSTVTVGNLNGIRDYLNNLSGEVRATPKPGVFEPTADAAAAMALKQHLGDYLENIPQDHIVAGDSQAFQALTKEANANYGAGKRTQGVEARLKDAQDLYDRQIAGSLESQIKSKIGGLLKSKDSRGFTPQELKQVQLVNSGDLISNALRQAGRLSPRLGTQGVVALATGGTSIPAQLATLPFYAARKASEAMTGNRAKELAAMLAKRSPLYQSRVNALPAADVMSGKAAVLRALLSGAGH